MAKLNNKTAAVNTKTTDKKTVKGTQSKAVPKYSYKTVKSVSTDKDFSKFIKQQDKAVASRLKERGIKLSSVKHISYQKQEQYISGKLKSIADKYYIKLKDNSLKVINISKSFKIK